MQVRHGPTKPHMSNCTCSSRRPPWPTCNYAISAGSFLLAQSVRHGISICWTLLAMFKDTQRKCLPLMYGEQIVSEAPGEVLTLDHCHIGESESGAKYILLLKCTFSSICEVIPTISTDAVPAARAIISWITRWGLPKAIITDGPTSFKNTLLKEITDTLRIKHHICLSYSPWTNGGIERQNREMLKFSGQFCLSQEPHGVS